MYIGSDHRIVSAKIRKKNNNKTKQNKQTNTTTTTTKTTWPNKIRTIKKRRAGSRSYGLKRKDKSSNWKQKTAQVECFKIIEAGVDDQYQLISDTLVEVAAEIAPQGKRKKQITEQGTIETLDRKRYELRETRGKNTSQKITYTIHANLWKYKPVFWSPQTCIFQ